MSDDGEWTVINYNKKERAKKPRIRKDSTKLGINFQLNRPNVDLSQEDADFDDEHVRIDKLENPTFWNECALVGNIVRRVNEILVKYQIFPKGRVMKLIACLNTISKFISEDDLIHRFENTVNLLPRKVIFVSVIPRFTTREYGHGAEIYLIHIRFDWYLLAESNLEQYVDSFLDGFTDYPGYLGEKHTHIPISASGENVTGNIENFKQVMKILKDKRKPDKFQPDYQPDDSGLFEQNMNTPKPNKPSYYSFEPSETLSKNVYICKLFLEDAHSGYGEILKGSHIGRKIYLHNRKNCSRAFNGDIVEIKVFKDTKSRNDKKRKENDKSYTGRVVSVLSSDVQPVNKIFLCHVISGTTLMNPICKTIPVIYVDNKHAIELVKKNCNNLRNGLKMVIGIENIIQQKVLQTKAKDFANKSFVTVKKLENNLDATVQDIYYVDCFSCDFIFLVLYRKWDDSDRFPHGDIVGLYTPDVMFGNSLDLIKVSCDIPTIGIDDEMSLQNKIKAIKMEKMKLNSDKSIPNEKKKYFSLKYPNKPYHEIAFSYEKKSEKEFIVGIHISNVHSIVKPGDYLDECAKNRFFTFLLPNLDAADLCQLKPDYLLSTAVTNEFLSINMKNEVPVISFYFCVENNQTVIDTFMENESIVLNMEIDVNVTDDIVERNLDNYYFFINIYKFCQFHRIDRLSHIIPTECFHPNFKLKINQSAFIIDDELRYLANKKANIIFNESKYIDYVQISNWYDDALLNCNPKLSPSLRSKIRKLKNYEKSKLPHYFTLQFLTKVKNNPRINLFKCESLFPDVGIYHRKWQLITGTDITNPFIPDRQMVLSVTNPLSSYCDMLCQRILQLSERNDEELTIMMDKYNLQKINFDKYLKICNGFEIKHTFHAESFILDCVFDSFTEDKVYFHHPFLDLANYENFISFQSLGLNKEPIEKSNNVFGTESCLTFTWKTKIFIYNMEDIDEENFKLDTITLNDIYKFKIDVWRYSIISSEINPNDISEIKESLSQNNKYPDELTSEITETIDTTITLRIPINDRQVMRNQFNYDFSSGIMRIIPELLIINPHLRICLCHKSNPFKFFLHPQELSNINYKRFLDIKEYKSQFTILNRLEGIHQTITTGTNFFIHDVHIDWIAMKNSNTQSYVATDENIYGVVILDEIWTKSRFIKLIHDKTKIHDPANAFYEATAQNKMEYLLCLQSLIKKKNVYWVGHCRMADICLIEKNDNDKIENIRKDKKRKTDLKIHITLQLVHSSFPMKPIDNQIYSIEFMESPISSRIFERNLNKLKEETFTADVVMGNRFNEIGTKTVDFTKIKNKMTIPCKLNAAQLEAMTKSINYPLSLIWGPPGTGKTLVGCIIAFYYTVINKTEDVLSSLQSNIIDECSPEENTRKVTKPSVLYCGPSNQSVDVVAEKLNKIFGTNCPKMLRIFNTDIMNFDFPYAGAKIKPNSKGCPDSLKDIALHHIVRKTGKPHASKLQTYFNQLTQYKTRREMGRLDFAKLLKKYDKLLKRAFQDEIEEGNYEIVLTTAASSCKKLLESFIITQVILDECGMCSEPESLGPLMEKEDLMHVVLIGDHKQLRPIVTNIVARGKQLDKSLFERLYKPEQNYCTMLDTQYRMHPSICEFPSIYFYEQNHGRNMRKNRIYLKTSRCDSWTGIPDSKIVNNTLFNGLQYAGLYPYYKEDLKRNNVEIADMFWRKGGIRRENFKCYPLDIDFSKPEKIYEKILFINAMGTEINQEVSTSTGSSQSKSNMLEASIVEFLYKTLITKVDRRSPVNESVLVITQYRSQEFELTNICNKILEDNNISGAPRVSTVVKSQGSESDYVIFSTVRSLPSKEDIDINPTPGWISKYLGFITDENQFNVAITRAKKGLFIIGNSHLLSVNATWKALIDDLKRRRCFLDDILCLY